MLCYKKIKNLYTWYSCNTSKNYSKDKLFWHFTYYVNPSTTLTPAYK